MKWAKLCIIKKTEVLLKIKRLGGLKDDACSDDSLNTRPKLVTIENYWWSCCMTVYLTNI